MRLRWSPRLARLMRGVAASVGAALIVAACAGQTGFTWGGGSRSTGQWPTENTSCRAYAKRKAEQEFTIVQSGGPALDYTRTSGYDRAVGRYDAGRRQQELYDNCMKQRGYRPPEAAPSEGGEVTP